MATRVVAWLREQQWDVFQEVQTPSGAADIVAVQHKRVWVIEAKMRLSFEVLVQAERHIGHAHWVSVAVPTAHTALAARFCRLLRVGLIQVSGCGVFEKEDAPLHRGRVDKLLAKIEPEHRDHCAAGTPGGGGWSPFKRTCRDVLAYVREHPGCTLKEMVAGIKHHYATPSRARASLHAWIASRVVPGVCFEHPDRGNGRELRVVLTDAVDAIEARA